MDNLEEVLQSLSEFDQTVEKILSPELEQLLEHIAKTGRTVFPWHLLKPLVRFKLEKVLTEFFESGSPSNDYISDPTTKSQEFLPTVQKLINNLNCFSGTPFTIQRICELITQPRKHYKTTDKFLRGVEKNIMVVSTVQIDGSLITRSLAPPLTNGAVSPTDSIPINTAPSPPSKPSHNSPLNTNFQENGAITNIPSAVESAEQELQTSIAEDCRVNTNSELNRSQNGVTDETECTKTKSEKCPENGQVEQDIASDEKGVSELTPASDNSQKNIQNFTETPTQEKQTSDIEKQTSDIEKQTSEMDNETSEIEETTSEIKETPSEIEGTTTEIEGTTTEIEETTPEMEKPSEVENDEKPAAETTDSSNDEKMDES